ncbi:putative transport transmembrane protein [Heterostelium album PN500]|uniref:Putative transport transmembrane protein n=1 Tax=Heterostelium pallidum (strain ATCC 26659 / Pp 5 / PN500) TaxID=670386 RepID=D3BQ37_HETP5|nr:putative transport transmembrane protein [Heterostelium album PN500]EFA76588.1 putative transport transmembrane protein [Heterostelium album PN500]|eukprot:XP_020428720.1 putative transport transmembrane protein [Heterostelium album PN500]
MTDNNFFNENNIKFSSDGININQDNINLDESNINQYQNTNLNIRESNNSINNNNGNIIIHSIKENMDDDQISLHLNDEIDKYQIVSNQGFFEKWIGISRDDPLFKEKAGILVAVIFMIIPGLLLSSFEPLIYQHYVEHHYPYYTKDEMASKASRLKSIGDALPFVSSFISGPLIGLISDRIGRKKVLFFCLGCAFLDIIFQILCFQNYWMWPMFVTHFITGFSSASDPVLFAFIADITCKDERSRISALIGMTIGVSTLLTPLMTIGLLNWKAISIPYFSLMFYTICGLILFCLKESFNFCEGKPISKERRIAQYKSKKHSSNPFKSIYNLFKTSWYIGAYAILYFMFSFSLQDSSTTLYMYSKVRYDWSATQVSYLTCAVGACVIIWSVVCSGLLRFITDRGIVCVALLVSSVMHVLYAFSFDQYMFSVCICLGSFSLMLVSILQSIISKATPSDMQASILTGVTVLSSLSSFIGALSSENLFAYFISSSAPFYFPGMHFLIDSVIIFLTFAFSFYALKKIQEPPSQEESHTSMGIIDQRYKPLNDEL